ncbi:MAG: glycosyltransferase [Spirochaetia bacterium]|jgi:UDP:flavonoid glycosyltransferase YjiC (YdhE family)
MRITVLAVGSQGDVQPYAALGRGLARAGHAVTLASHETFRDLAKRCGIDFSLITGNPMDIVQGPEGQSWLGSSDRYVSFLLRAKKMAADLYPQISLDALAAAQGSDALIFSLPLTVCGYTVAAALRIPGIPAALYPLHPTGAFPSIMTPGVSLGRTINWLSGTAVMHLYWSIVRSLLGDFHKAQGLGRLPLQAPFRSMERQGLPFLYGYSPSVIPTPPNWRQNRAVCGYWFLEDAPGWKPEARLVDFLRDGPAPLYVGFGSMTSGDPSAMTRIILEAVRRTGQRAVLSAGWGGLHAPDLPQSVLPVGFVPHDWLFARVSMAIHHGGAGTTSVVLKAGAPSIVVPFFADQFFWGRRICALGIGPKPIPRKELTADSLEKAIRSVLESNSMTARARIISRAIRAEDGVAAAVTAVEGYLRSMARRRMA